MNRRTVTVRVPATSANMGPGFDALGIAIDLWNSVSLSMGEGNRVTITGEGASELSTDRDNAVYQAASHVFREAGLPRADLSITCHNSIPVGRGLGSSAAAAVAGVLAANTLCGQPLATKDLLELATTLEGHPDNVAPALLGGCQVVIRDGKSLVTTPVPVPDGLQCVVYVPNQRVPTTESRASLPEQLSRSDAVYNIGRVGLLINALATGRLKDLRVATQDRLHQPHRLKKFPAAKHIFRAALGAGALAVFLSGSGPSVLALTVEHAVTIGYEMADAANKLGAPGEVKITHPSTLGAHVVESR